MSTDLLSVMLKGLHDHATRMACADLLTDMSREDEAAILRNANTPVFVVGGKVVSLNTASGMYRFLISWFCKGFSDNLAFKIIQTFGDATFDIINDTPSFLREVRMIGPKRIARLRELVQGRNWPVIAERPKFVRRR